MKMVNETNPSWKSDLRNFTNSLFRLDRRSVTFLSIIALLSILLFISIVLLGIALIESGEYEPQIYSSNLLLNMTVFSLIVLGALCFLIFKRYAKNKQELIKIGIQAILVYSVLSLLFGVFTAIKSYEYIGVNAFFVILASISDTIASFILFSCFLVGFILLLYKYLNLCRIAIVFLIGIILSILSNLLNLAFSVSTFFTLSVLSSGLIAVFLYSTFRYLRVYSKIGERPMFVLGTLGLLLAFLMIIAAGADSLSGLPLDITMGSVYVRAVQTLIFYGLLGVSFRVLDKRDSAPEKNCV